MASLLAAGSLSADLRRALRRVSRRIAVRRAKLLARPSVSHVLLSLLLLVFTLTLLSSSSSSLWQSEPLLIPSHEPRMQLFSVHPSVNHTAHFIPNVAPALSPQLRAHVDRIVRGVACAHTALHSLYDVPPMVVRCMTHRVAYTLLWKLVLADMLANPDAHNMYARTRVLFVHTQNGLGNRLRALASGLAMARATGRVPVVIWENDPHLSAPFEEILNPRRNSSTLQGVLYDDLIIMDHFLPWNIVSDQNASWHAVSYMEKDGRDSEPGILMRFQMPDSNHASVQNWLQYAQQYPQLRDGSAQLTISKPLAVDLKLREQKATNLIQTTGHVYFKSAYVANTEPQSMSVRSVVNNELTLLTPSHSVMQIVKQLNPDDLRRAIGVHIRSRSLARDNVDVRTRCEYTRVGARITDYWRSRSSLKVFVKKMKWALARQKTVKFFVASDDVAVLQTLKERFGNERILHLERNCDDRLEGCVKYAMADLICLARTRKIYGSNWSSFSEAAGRLGGKNVYLSGRHFGRLKGFARHWDKIQSGFYLTVDRFLSMWPSWLALPWNRC
eukprot:TRINITY_DN45_c0_g1_i1.p1 TRINITY_DN45_c0_g1~~TRINITY_DN45_c0_g1_i1.p1  ORF type:complete len:558 (-),score=64.21 TRINITY_DN45_c0_g1_i1:3159-4832(-)